MPSLTAVFCCNCLRVTMCATERTYDEWVFTCTECGKVAEREFIDLYDDESTEFCP